MFKKAVEWDITETIRNLRETLDGSFGARHGLIRR
jgi:hypothetical protein